MKDIVVNEIIEASTQKSIVSGQPGFGVRTYTEGMDSDFVQRVVGQVGCAYEIGMSHQVSMQSLLDDPGVTATFPRTLKYTAVTDADGREHYVVACSTYVGVDYGFFCGNESACRAGTNYVADILVLDSKPTADLFYRLVACNGGRGAFLPADNTCRPDNAELQRLLTGEPRLLSPRTVAAGDAGSLGISVDDSTALVAMALLQTKINADLGRDESLCSIVFRTKECQVAKVLGSLALLPDRLVADMFFQTNYLQGYGMPNGYRMIFLNEFNEQQVYTDNYVCLDLCDGTFGNCDTGNYFFVKIREAAAAGDGMLLRKLAAYLYGVTVNAGTDYRFLYNLFAATQTSGGVALSGLTPDFFDKVVEAGLPAATLGVLKASVARTVSAALEQARAASGPDAYRQVLAVMDVVDCMQRRVPELLCLSRDDKARLTRVMFLDRRLPDFLGRYDLQTVRRVNTCDVPSDDFFDSLAGVADADAWPVLVGDMFAGWRADPAVSESIVDAVMRSVVPDREGLVVSFFPVADNADFLSAYLCAHPRATAALRSVTSALCLARGYGQMASLLTSADCSAEAVEAVQPVAEEYFMGRVKADVIGGIVLVGKFAEAIGPNNFVKFNLMPVFDVFAGHCFAAPGSVDIKWLAFFLDNAQLSDVAGSRLKAICRLRGKKVDTGAIEGTLDELLIAKRLDLQPDVRLDIVAACLVKGIEPAALTAYVGDGRRANFAEMRHIVDRVWACEPKIGEAAAESYTLAIVGSCRWTKHERVEYMSACRNPKAEACIKKNFSFMKIVTRRFFK